MDTERYVDATNRTALLRYERLSKGYQAITPKGPRNAGYFRDNVMDMLEEVTDVVNIAGILFERLVEDDHQALLLAAGGLQLIQDAVNTFIAACVYLDSKLPASFRVEDVERVVSREEAGLCVDG